MAKVDAKVGFTLKISKASQYEFIRPEIGISDIDTDKDIKVQLDLAEKALLETWEKVTDIASDEIISKIGDYDPDVKMQIQKKFKQVDIAIEEIKNEIINIIGEKNA
jgi:hypothetical protein